MKQGRFGKLFSISVVCATLIFSGCDQQVQQIVNLQMKPIADQQATYKVTTEAQQILTYEGSFEDKEKFKGGHNLNLAEMTFTQKIEGINSQGNIVANITIDSLKLSSVLRDEPTFDYDSEKKNNNVLNKLIGQSYSIELSPQLEVKRVFNISGARSLVAGTGEANKRAQLLLNDDEIKQRHSVTGLGSKDVTKAKVGDKWSSDKKFTFPIIGAKSYERVYTLKKIEQKDGKKIAVIEMEGLPAASGEGEKNPVLMNMFDNIRSYSGQFKLDIDDGIVQSYIEKFDSEWTFVDPAHDANSDKPPASFKLGAVRLHSIERIN